MTPPDPDTTPLQPRDTAHAIDHVRTVDDVLAVAALEEPNRRRLYDLVVNAHDDVGRDLAAERLGMSRELAAFHLDRLVDVGLLEAGYRRLSGRTGPGAGRPAKVYRRAGRDLAVTLPPRRYEVLADLFAEGLAALEREVGTPTVEAALAGPARARGRAVGVAARRAAGARPGHPRLLESLRELLARQGYEPTVSVADPADPGAAGSGASDEPTGSATISLCNCPYRSLAEAHRDLTCGANVAWAEGVVDGLGDSDLTAEYVPTPGRCCVRFAEAAGS